MQVLTDFWSSYGDTIWNLLMAILLLLAGWILASVLRGVTRRLMASTGWDERLSATMSGNDGGPNVSLQKIVPTGVFWVVMLFVLVAFFNMLNLPAVSGPFQNVLDQIFGFIPGFAGAAIVLGVAWLIATLVRMFIVKVLGERLSLDRRLSRAGAIEAGEPSLTQTIGQIAFWLILLMALPMALGRLGLTELIAPIQSMFNDMLGFVPNLLGAAIIFVIGYFVARIVRQIISSLAASVGVDGWAERAGLTGTKVSELIGTIVFAVILIPSIIAALDRLGVEAISQPAVEMLGIITGIIPGLIGAIAVLVIVYYVGKLISNLLVDILEGAGFNSVPARLGINTTFERSPSSIVGSLILAGFMLFATMEAAAMIGFDSLSVIVSQVLAFASQILVGIVVLALGMWVANFVHGVVSATSNKNADMLANLARYGILFLVGTMALRQMGIASQTIDLAFGITLGAIGVGAALAIGLGSRETAGREVARFVNRLRGENPTGSHLDANTSVRATGD
ncbi:MAG: mechanosensitive ion channel [Chloroflexota bacterium]